MAATKEQAAASKAAAMKIKAKGITPYKHEQSVIKAVEEGVDTAPVAGVQSGFSIFNPPAQGTIMTDPVTPQAQVDKEAAAKAKVAAKEAKIAAAAQAKADKEAAAKAKADEKAAAKAQKEADLAEARRIRDEAIAKAKEAGETVRERTYDGSMLALADKVKAGIYTKGKNGQLRSGDELALALESVPASAMVGLLLKVLGLAVNPYAELNYGQQSMNLRNRLRGAIRKEAKIADTDVMINMARVTELAAEATPAPAAKAKAEAEVPAE